MKIKKQSTTPQPPKAKRKLAPLPPGFIFALGLLFGTSFGLIINNVYTGIIVGAMITGIIELRAFARRNS